MRHVDVIALKRDGHPLTPEVIDLFVSGVTDGTWPDYQAAALLMAIVLRGMTPDETHALTDAMVRSGERVDLSDVPGAKVGKHSTGGVGDKVSIVLAPLAAACGLVVPKMSGRGLGHTGGTLDKLESIPGFRIDLGIDEFKAALRRVGTAIIGQTALLAPADKKLYALRDVTATVPSVPLISASVMSKKLAEGCEGLVLDVKCGQGAFMKTEAEARALAESLVTIGTRAGVRTEALITNMEAPLGCAIGNALEIIECIEILKGTGPRDVSELAIGLASRMLVVGNRASDSDADATVRRVLASGEGLSRLRAMIAQQGGDSSVVDDYARLPGARQRHAVLADRRGFVSRLDAELVGRASMALGAGRARVEERIDHGAGILLQRKPGDAVSAGDPILDLLYNDESGLEEALALVREAISIAPEPPVVRPLILGTVA
jgi:pyrimidine-nucleoside phosphorylase